MLTKAQIDDAAARLEEAERSGRQIGQLSLQYPGLTIDDAYRIQSAWVALKVSGGRVIKGRKIGLTSRAMQSAVNIDEPDYGVLLDDMVYPDGGKIKASDFCVPRVEVELAFVLKKPLKGPGVGLIDVLRATEYVVPSLELIDARLKDPRKIYDTISDNGAAAGIVLGGRPVEPEDVDLRWVGCALYKNGEVEETGLASGVMGHPAMGIAWLANKVGPHGVTLEPGHTMLAGSFTRPVWCKAGDTIHADFGPLGNVTVQFV